MLLGAVKRVNSAGITALIAALKITHALTDKYEFLCNFVSITTNGLICDHDSAEPWWGECVRAQARLRLREDPEILWLRLLIQLLSKITTTTIETPSI